MDDPRPRLIAERYELGDLIGAGGMGRVFRATDLETGSVVAVKQLQLASSGTDPAIAERFRREGDALRRLNHPNIVRVLDIVEGDMGAYLVMEYAEGGSLEDLLLSTEHPLSISRVLQIALDLSDALIRTHRLEIVHRDLKPANVLLAADGTPRLTDFGAAYVQDKERLTRASAIIGTVEYLSPESLRGEVTDPRADLWSFGVLLFEMLTRTRPFSHASVPQTLHSIVFSSPPDLRALRPDCPPELVNLVYRLLAKNPSERVPSARQLSAELDHIVHGRASAAVTTDLRGQSPDPPAPAVRSNLRTSTKTFVGRQTELSALERTLRVADTRLVTIVAPGGMGKTRLMVELGTRLLAGAQSERRGRAFRFEHGVFLVELAPLGAPEFVVSAIAEAAGIQFFSRRDPKQQLLDYFRGKRALLLMDNFEHVLPAATLISELLQAAPGLGVVATSRERLGLSLETVFPLAGMEVPASARDDRAVETPAVKLFAQGARQQRHHFEMSASDVDDVLRICQLVEGVPLGIVLASTWAGTLSLREIGDEISRSLDFLAAELRDLPERQRSMRAIFDHSWALLDEREREVLAALSVFRGGFTREAAHTVANGDLRTLASLMRKSLLRRDANSGRYDLHELLRQYADGKLQALEGGPRSVIARRDAYFASHLRERERVLQGSHPREALAEIEAELDNVRAAWSSMTTLGRTDLLSACMEALNLFYTLRASFAEGESAFAMLAEMPQPTNSDRPGELDWVRARAASFQAMFLRQQGRYTQAEQLLDWALAVLEERTHPRERAFALVATGSTMTKTGKLLRGQQLAEQGLELYRSASDAWGLAHALETLGRIYGTSGDFARSERAFRESTVVQRSAGLMQSGLMGLAVATIQQGRYAEGCGMLLDALDMFERAGDVWNKMRCQMNLANVQRNLGNYGSAESLATSCLLFWQEVGNWDHEAWCYFQLGNIAKEQGRQDRARQMYTIAQSRSLQTGDAGKIALAKLEFGGLAVLRNDYTDARRHFLESLTGFESAGQTWGTSLALDALGELACIERDFAGSRAHFQRALSISMGLRLYPFAMNVVAGIAVLLAREGRPETALELVGFVQSHAATERHTLTRRVVPLAAELRSTMGAEGFAQVLARGHALNLSNIEAHLRRAGFGVASS